MSEREENIIALLVKHVNDMDNEFDTLDKKAQQNIGVSSIVAAIVGTLKLNEVLPQGVNDLWLLLIFGVYIASFAASFFALYPQTWKRTPLDPSQDNIEKVKQKSDAEYYDWIVKSYLYILRENKRVLRWKNRLVVAGMIAIALDIIAIGAAAVVN